MIEWIIDLFTDRNFGAIRSGKWSSVRKSFIALHPTCAVCGTSGSFLKPNEVHHRQPFHLKPSLECDEKNLITLCRVHHLWVGHLGSFKSYNKEVAKDAKLWLKKIISRP